MLQNFKVKALAFALLSVVSVASAKTTYLQPADLAILFDRTETPARRDRLIGLRDLGITDQDMAAILIHARHDLVISSEWRRNAAGYEQDRRINRESESFFLDSCFMDINSWKVSAIRFSPFEYTLPGSAENLDAYTRVNALRSIDRAFEIRFTLTPLCPSVEDPTTLVSLDAGMHLVYNVWPEDETLRSTLLATREAFIKQGSQAALAQHMVALTSPQYEKFHKDLIMQLDRLASYRGKTNAASGPLSRLYESVKTIFSLTMLDDEAEEINTPAEQDRATLPLRWVSDQDKFQNEIYFTALKELSTKFAARKNLTRVALNILHGADSWQLSGLVAVPAYVPGVFHEKDDAKARRYFTKLMPQELKTVQAVMDSKKRLSIKEVSTSGYYADLSIPSLNKRTAQVAGIEIKDQRLFSQIDFYQGENRIGDLILEPPPNPRDSIPLMRLLNNVGRANAHTTSCSTCHTLTVASLYTDENGKTSEEISSVFSPEPQHNVRMMGFGRESGEPTIRSITVNQVMIEMKKIKAYLDK